ncbi:MAG TPA: type 2 lanthipeptide synthetase LanM family protein [Ktedonobacteraceae bacterium]|nr:type 2 lanthipeptide synthetase LanM family protein [Ktedonobacteraceae bacterium]
MQEEQDLATNPEAVLWYLATSLQERLPLPISTASRSSVSPERLERARRKLEEWLEIFGNEAALYREWLAHRSLSEADLLYLFAETPTELGARLQHEPAWFRTFTTAFASYGEQGESLVELLQSGDAAASREQGGAHADIAVLLTVVEPLLRLARERLQEKIRSFETNIAGPVLVADTLLSSLFTSLVERLQKLLTRTLILEFRVAQQRGLLSESANLQEALLLYARHLRQRENAFAFFMEYPVLARQVTVAVEQWCECNEELLTRLGQDWSAIQSFFCPEREAGALREVVSHLGDRHQNGRAVQLLLFDSGLRLVYKPRSLNVDEHFQALLQWLNERGQEPRLPLLRVLNRGSYGWMEWVEARDCTTHEEVERFYLRQGANLALLYALEATDFHYENIIAAGENPVLVDLESLLHVTLQPGSGRLGPAELLAYENVTSSVLRTLLLPYRAPHEHDQPSPEISGLGGAPGQVVEGKSLHLSGFDTGELRYVRGQAILEGGKNRPHLNGAEVDIFAYLPFISEGFAHTYRLLLRHREALLAEDGVLGRFAHATTRLVLRPTAHYAQLSLSLLHPYLLHDELDQERVSNILWRIVKDRPQMKAVIESEQVALRRGDIPFFTCQGGSRDLWASPTEYFKDFLPRSGLESLRQLWQKMSEQDLQRQLWFIQAAFTTLLPGEEMRQEGHPVEPLPVVEQQQAPLDSHDDLLLAAREIGDRICQLASLEDDDATWFGLAQTRESQWTLMLADANIYSGLTGILFTLAYLGHITHTEVYTQIARKALTTVRRKIARDQHDIKDVGFFAGWGGVIAVLAHLSVLWQEETLLNEAFHIVDLLPPLIDEDRGLDIVRGSAGCIAGLLCLESVAPDPRIEPLLLRCGERLIASASPQSTGVGWQVFERMPCLTGFAHGNAGFAWALLKLAKRTGAERFYQLAQDAQAYERSLYNPDFKNWRDMRSINEETYRLAWCYGAPGIGLARLDTLNVLDDEVVRAEIRVALETTLARGFGGSHALCHGDLGNLELLLHMQLVAPERRWQAAYELIKAAIFQRGRQHGWLCGTPQQVETPGLMIGLTGICLQLLRLAEPEHVPSILTMDPPGKVHAVESGYVRV